MQLVATIILCMSVLLLIISASVSPKRSRISHYELKRRCNNGDKAAIDELEREALVDSSVGFLRLVTNLLVISVTLSSIWVLGWTWGVILGVVVTILSAVIAQTKIVTKIVDDMYQPYDTSLMALMRRRPWNSIRLGMNSVNTVDLTVHSREEFEHIVSLAGPILTADEKLQITSVMHFSEKIVESVMVPSASIDSVSKSELIGPLLLDELHRTGHSRFPVIDGDIDHIVGVLHIRERLSLKDKKSQTVEKAMDAEVYYIRSGQTLSDALATAIKTRQSLFVVVNEQAETVGLLALEDITREMLGSEIVDSHDSHTVKHKVAARKVGDSRAAARR